MPLGGSGLEGAVSGGGTGVVDSPLLLQAFGTAAAPELAFVGNTGSGLFSPALNQLGLAAGNQELLRLVEGVQEQVIVSPGALFGTAALPALAFGDADSGIREPSDDVLAVSLAGTDRFRFEANQFRSEVGSGPAMLNEGASSSNPNFVPNQADDDTGYTRSGVNQLSHVCGGVEALRVRATTATVGAASNLLVWSYDDSALRFLEFGADDSAGSGFKTVRVAN